MITVLIMTGATILGGTLGWACALIAEAYGRTHQPPTSPQRPHGKGWL